MRAVHEGSQQRYQVLQQLVFELFVAGRCRHRLHRIELCGSHLGNQAGLLTQLKKFLLRPLGGRCGEHLSDPPVRR